MKTLSALASLSLTGVLAAQSPDFDLNLNAHLNATLGTASSVDEAELATHGHDPNDNFTLQGLELNASARYGQHLAGFASYNTFLDEHDDIDGEWEDAFLKLEQLPGNFELRAGRIFNRATSQNSQHLHSWAFVDANLITARFLGDEGLLTNSVEASWILPLDQTVIFSAAFGNAVAHEHEHEEDHDHGHHHDEIEGEGALFNDDIISLRLAGQYRHSDFRQWNYGISYIHGDNGFGRSGELYGADLEYLWRENGIQAGGKHFRAQIEAVYRTFDFQSEDGDLSGDADEWGMHTTLGWGFAENWELAGRYGFLEGVQEPVEELGERHRFSLALTRSMTVNDWVAGHLRLQYNHDKSNEFGNEDSIWLQWQIDLGKGGEIR